MATNEDIVWEKVRLARHPKRPTASLVISQLCPDFLELHGDRQFGDDFSMITGLATFQGIPVTIIAQEKGTNTEEKIARNFGMPHPEGYRKALRLMKMAEKFNKPIVTFIDTPGAFQGLEAEERGQGEGIARNI
jgi:acetyl-CoA carboxylase carboxyl transferase subunit alpha